MLMMTPKKPTVVFTACPAKSVTQEDWMFLAISPPRSCMGGMRHWVYFPMKSTIWS